MHLFIFSILLAILVVSYARFYPSQDRSKLESELCRMCGGNQDVANSLVAHEYRRRPHTGRVRALSNAISRLKRDQGYA
ncbi:hypothetical protein HBA55_24750 [Pseudomaricurvus alkylphenolicus]|jgi:hypothetical protein|uniref:hypothetical protein n=1 Tax=Pseudomaricurvus alkylphenolicus TaxID=1306991 RepID=UPI0014248754|nr:hypothetical protein [Pseudomaricurvus alkylphenolicus]NIB42839.1 hypothetical protein [Pseudomaricurvus alkylphenolicus]